MHNAASDSRLLTHSHSLNSTDWFLVVVVSNTGFLVLVWFLKIAVLMMLSNSVWFSFGNCSRADAMGYARCSTCCFASLPAVWRLRRITFRLTVFSASPFFWQLKLPVCWKFYLQFQACVLAL